MTFDRVEVAARVRDVIRRQAEQVVSQQAPRPNFGRVISIDAVALTGTVWFPGDDQPTKVKLFSSTIPGQWQERFGLGSGFGVTNTSTQGFGSIVAVEKFNDSLYVTEVLNGGQFSIDWATAGDVVEQYNEFSVPGDPAGADYAFNPRWYTVSVYPGFTLQSGNGGPYAINIGPFIGANDDQIGNSVHEVEICAEIGLSQYYKFTLNPYWLTSKNNTGSLFDRWFRVIPDKVNQDDVSGNTVRTVNYNTNFFTGAGDFVARTNTASVWSNTFTNSFGGSLRLVSTNAAQVTIESATNNSGKFYQVIPGAQYSLTGDFLSPSLWNGGSRVGVEWYDSTGALLSTTLTPNVNLVANTWATSSTAALTAPANAVLAALKFSITGTPPTSQFFYCDNLFLRTVDSVTMTDFSLDVAMRRTIHGSTTQDLSDNNNGELWIRIYIHWLDALSDPGFKVRYRNTGGWSQAKSLQTGKPIYEFVASPADALGYLGYHDSNVGYTTNSTTYLQTQNGVWSSSTWRNPDLTLGYRAQEVLSGGGIIAWDGTNFKWTAPFEVGGIGRSRHGLLLGKSQLTMPTSGSIPVFPAGTTVAPSASGIPLASGQALYFGIPPGVGSSIPNASYVGGGLHGAGGLFIVDSLNARWWSPPEWAVLIAYRQTDATQPEIKCGNGQTYDKWRSVTFAGAWANYTGGGSWAQAAYTKDGSGFVHLRGLVQAGTAGSTIFTLPAGYRPGSGNDQLFSNIASANVVCRIDVFSTGVVSWNSGGTNVFVSLSGITFFAEQ